MPSNGGARTHVGIVLTTPSLNFLFANAEAMRILSDGVSSRLPPREPVERKIRELAQPFNLRAPFVTDFRSGKRHYLCWAFPLDASSDIMPPTGGNRPGFAFLFLRSLIGTINFEYAARYYNLTPREQTAVTLLVQGLPYKEIASQMGVSLNTVRAFLRLVMGKVRATTRTELIKKMLDQCYIGFGAGVPQ
jgi:DNA-binding CsgD family transcriptional regulator